MRYCLDHQTRTLSERHKRTTDALETTDPDEAMMFLDVEKAGFSLTRFDCGDFIVIEFANGDRTYRRLVDDPDDFNVGVFMLVKRVLASIAEEKRNAASDGEGSPDAG